MPPPTIGSLVDDGTLELVSLIGQGGFASVYLARSTTCNKVYALKVLHNPPSPTTRDYIADFDTEEERGPRPHHLREVKLHSLCTSRSKKNSSITPLLKTIFHPTTTTLHTCLLLPYYPSGDLFSAILTHKLFLANPSLIKSTFLQILSGVDEAHSVGVFLRDLKPENCLLDGNGRVFLCDFGLATDEILSEEFRTGSVYHMSPECMGPRPYSPRQSDIWSLGILLLNLLTSRNPWKEANMKDPTFAAYYHSHPSIQALSPSSSQPILPLILPVSERLSDILHMILHPIPSGRLTLEEIKSCCEDLDEDKMDDWYDPKAIFDWEGGCARCLWEIEGGVESEEQVGEGLKSTWSTGSDSCKGSILRRSIHSTTDSIPSPLFENTYPPSLAVGSAHIRGTSSSSSNSTSLSPDYCGVPVSTPKRNRNTTTNHSWRVFEDEAPGIPPTESNCSPSSLSPIHRALSVDSLTTSFLHNINVAVDSCSLSHSRSKSRSRSRPRPDQIFTAPSAAVHVDSNGVPKTPKDVLASLGTNVGVRSHDEDIELEVTGSNSVAHGERGRGDIPVIEWVEQERREEGKNRRKGKGKGRRNFFDGIGFGRMLFGGGENS